MEEVPVPGHPWLLQLIYRTKTLETRPAYIVGRFVLRGGQSLIVWALEVRVWTRHRYVCVRRGGQEVEDEQSWAQAGAWMQLLNGEQLYGLQLRSV